MRNWQVLRELLPPEVTIDPTGQSDAVRIHAGGRARQFRLVECEHLTREWVDSVAIRSLSSS